MTNRTTFTENSKYIRYSKTQPFQKHCRQHTENSKYIRYRDTTISKKKKKKKALQTTYLGLLYALYPLLCFGSHARKTNSPYVISQVDVHQIISMNQHALQSSSPYHCQNRWVHNEQKQYEGMQYLPCNRRTISTWAKMST